jgi:hypothetical protein
LAIEVNQQVFPEGRDLGNGHSDQLPAERRNCPVRSADGVEHSPNDWLESLRRVFERVAFRHGVVSAAGDR